MIEPMIGMMMSPTSELTMAPKAAPMMTPTARSTTLPFIANSRNSFSTLRPPFSLSSDETCRLLAGLVDQARMHHGIADHLAGRRRHIHQRQAHFFLEPPQQFEAMLGARQAGLLEDRIMQRRQAVLDLQSGSVIALQDARTSAPRTVSAPRWRPPRCSHVLPPPYRPARSCPRRTAG